ncbi:SURF1 family protein [Allosphingosinicella vermicomposti]|uniref:SURF1 family protein n=1 Tax=Allosphingosinicella vermicomposti TaxID=614671 RepID=UPI000D0EFE72|nr:SURF1 family protein [Allosphingosinicella vermicomposti]
MKRLPLLPTVIVGAAIATMIGLGIWQLQRADWKEGLIARYEAASGLPPVAWPSVPPADDDLLYRRAEGFCTEVTGWRAVAGHNANAQTGWSHIAACRTGAEGPGMQVDMGWSRDAAAPDWTGGRVSGVIAPDSVHRIRLVSIEAAPGLVPSAAPDPGEMPNNHLSYAIQWFLFAGIAGVIYGLALRHRQKGLTAPPVPPATGR